jgi:spore maturation protein SpmB
MTMICLLLDAVTAFGIVDGGDKGFAAYAKEQFPMVMAAMMNSDIISEANRLRKILRIITVAVFLLSAGKTDRTVPLSSPMSMSI